MQRRITPECSVILSVRDVLEDRGYGWPRVCIGQPESCTNRAPSGSSIHSWGLIVTLTISMFLVRFDNR